MPARLDHLIVTAPTLEAGVAAVEAALGVGLAAGGRHVLMGTHNALLRLGPRLYLEVIAIDPAAPVPERPRWFGLDTPPTQVQLAHWALASDALGRDAAVLGLAADELLDMRRGDFAWRIGVPRDGALPGQGLLPSLIQWAGEHPAARLPDAGCALATLACRVPDPAPLEHALRQLDFDDGRVSIAAGPPRLQALIDTPTGRRPLWADTAQTRTRPETTCSTRY